MTDPRPTTMHAILPTDPGGPEVLQLGDLPTPELRSGEVLIRVVAAGVNRADLMQRQGFYPPPPGASDVIGLEVSGQIAELGPDVGGWALDDPCVALLAGGGYAEYVAVPAGQVLPPPPGLPLVDAGGVLEVAATVVANLDLAGLRGGEVFLVHGGAGGIGAFAIQYATQLGATVVATAGTEEKLRVCRDLGAQHAFSYRDDWAGAVRAATDERGVDVILDNMGAKYLAEHVSLLASHGRLVIIGMQGGQQGTLDIGSLLRRWGTVTATSLRARPTAEKTEICRLVRERVWPLYAAGRIRPPIVRTFPLAEAAAAHTRLESGDNSGKLVLTL